MTTTKRKKAKLTPRQRKVLKACIKHAQSDCGTIKFSADVINLGGANAFGQSVAKIMLQTINENQRDECKRSVFGFVSNLLDGKPKRLCKLLLSLVTDIDNSFYIAVINRSKPYGATKRVLRIGAYPRRISDIGLAKPKHRNDIDFKTSFDNYEIEIIKPTLTL